MQGSGPGWLDSGARGLGGMAGVGRLAKLPCGRVAKWIVVLVYERTGGLTAEDRAAAARHVAAYGGLENVDSKVIGPIPSQDGQALQVIVPIDAGAGGWEA